MPEIQITRIAADDESALLTWNDVMRTAYTHDRTAAWWRSAETTLTQFAHPRPGGQDLSLIHI